MYEDESPPLTDTEGEPLEPEEAPKPKYWAAFEPEELGPELVERVKEHYSALESAGLIALWRKVHAHFYGLDPDGAHESSTIIEFGDDGEKLGVRSNQLRSLVRYMVTTATADRPAVMPKAINSTAKAMAQVPTARRVLEYYHRKRKLERKLKGVALRAALYGKGYLWQGWDPTLAKGLGDLFYRACSPLEVSHDLERDADDNDWYIIRRPRNKYDAAAQYAKDEAEAEEILALGKDCLDDSTVSAIAFGLHRKDKDNDSDTMFEYHFLHRATQAMPKGRYAIFAGEGKILFDGPLPYEELPVDQMIPEEFLETGSIGYASAWDLIGLQEWYDALLSTCMTNFDAFGHNDMLLPDGVELSVEEIRDGLNVIRYPAGEFNRPSVLEKFSIREEAFKLRDVIKSDMEINYGVNSVARGEPEASLKSGAALALVQAQSVHFQSGFVESYVYLNEDASDKTLQIVRKYASAERIAQIAGENDPDGVRAFVDPALDLIGGTECERINPIFRTLGGKFDIANNLLERGLIKNIGQYYQVLETGRLEPVTDPDRKCEAQIQAENEILMTGPRPRMGKPDQMTGQPAPEVENLPALWTDDPIKHIKAHASVLDSPEMRSNPQVVMAVTYHIMHHLTAWRQAPKDGLMLLGYPPPPPLPGDPIMQPGPEAGPEGPAGAGKTQDTGAKPPKNGKQDANAAPDEGGGMPSLPKAPTRDTLGNPTH